VVLLGLGLLVPTAFDAGTPAALPFVLGVWALCAILLYLTVRETRDPAPADA
jgi:hypothetical protein